MLQWAEIRRRVLVDGVSKRQILRETGMHWTTLEKILRHSEPPASGSDTPRAKPKLGPYLDRIARILEDDKQAPRKQRHTAKRIYQATPRLNPALPAYQIGRQLLCPSGEPFNYPQPGGSTRSRGGCP